LLILPIDNPSSCREGSAAAQEAQEQVCVLLSL